ncbi:MAG: hypothetical protein ACTSWR_04315 [Candidatus Helarchaeota archaeon]
MSYVNIIKKYFYSERIVPAFFSAFLLALPLEMVHFLTMLVAGFVAGIFIKKGWTSFLIGFIGVMAAWGVYFLIFTFIGPLDRLLSFIGQLIGINGIVLILISLIIGGLLGGMGALIGGYSMQLILGDNYNPKEKPKLL